MSQKYIFLCIVTYSYIGGYVELPDSLTYSICILSNYDGAIMYH